MRPGAAHRLFAAGIVALVTGLGAGVAAGAPAPASAASPRPRRVVIVTVGGLTWEDVAAGRVPAVRSLGNQWSMAALSIRTVDTHTDAASAFATIGAGNRTRGDSPEVNRKLHFGAVIGALGGTLSQHGLTTGWAGTNPVLEAAALGHGAPAAVQGGDPVQADVGLVDLGLDPSGLDQAISRVDLARDTLLVLSPYQAPSRPDRLMVAVAAGVGARPGGWLTSAATHRDGLITMTDIAPGILALFDIKPPPSMTGQPFHAVAAPGGSVRLRRLLGLQRAAVANSQREGWFMAGLGTLAVAVLVAGGHGLRRAEADPQSARPVVVGGLFAAALPLACLAQAAAGAERWGAPAAFGFLAATAVAIVAVALAGPWRRNRLAPAVIVATATAVAILGDLVTGSRGQITNLIGYSPIVGGRYYGLPALSFAVLATYSLILAGLLAGAFPERPRRALAAVAGVGVVTVAIAGAPMFGAKFGSILTLVPAFGLLLILVSGRRLSLGRAALIAVATGVVALGIGVADALRPAQSQTHLGRFVAALLGGGPGSVSDVIHRKADANLGVFVQAPYAIVVPALLVLLAYAVVRGPGGLGPAIGRVPGLREGLLAVIAALAVGLLVNDSGAAIPAMGLGVGVPLAIALIASTASGWGRQ